jgi:membrane protease YdiL (CAAX protease family)
MGAFVCFLLFWIAQAFLIPAIQFFGGRMMGLTLGMLLSAALSSALAMTIFESRPMTDLGMRWVPASGRNLAIGVSLGVAAGAVVILLPVAAGMAQFGTVAHPDISWRGALFLPVLLACGAMAEELAFRGFVFQYLARGWGAWAAMLGTGALFGIMHDGNPGATLVSDINTGLFGVLFGFAVLRSHDLWVAVGLHFGWNVTLPFGGAVLSGLTIRVTGYELVWKSGDLWSGGKYGPEASPLTTLLLGLLFLALWKVPLHRSWAWLLDVPEARRGQTSLDLPEPPAS